MADSCFLNKLPGFVLMGQSCMLPLEGRGGQGSSGGTKLSDVMQQDQHLLGLLQIRHYTGHKKCTKFKVTDLRPDTLEENNGSIKISQETPKDCMSGATSPVPKMNAVPQGCVFGHGGGLCWKTGEVNCQGALKSVHFAFPLDKSEFKCLSAEQTLYFLGKCVSFPTSCAVSARLSHIL